MANPTALTQFGQWLAKQQRRLLTELRKKQKQAQELLIKGLRDAQPLQGPPPGRHRD